MIKTPATATENSTNRKTGVVSTTMSSLKTCPDDCPLKGNGCYAESYPLRMHVRQMDEAAEHFTRAQIATIEASEIDKLTGWRPLRLHVVGDCTDAKSAKVVSAACDRYRHQHGSPVWAYTHSWRKVPKAAWGEVSIFASLERPIDIPKAFDRGYGVVLVKDLQGKKTQKVDGYKLVQCPAEISDKNCERCKLCFDAEKLRQKKTVICFAPHGNQKTKCQNTIARLNGEGR